MGKLKDYIDYLKKKVDSMGDLSEIEILRFVYIDLGKKLDFDINYTFGNSKQKEKIYNKQIDEEEYDRILESHSTICKGISYLYSRIMREFGIPVSVERTDGGKHVYNEYISGKKAYKLDLENDLEYIQTGSKTVSFLKSFEEKTYPDLLTEEELRKIDTEKIGYIKEGYYFDDVIWMLKKAVSNESLSLEEKMDFVLYNSDKYCDMKHVKYRERMNYQSRLFCEVFSKSELNKIHRIDGVTQDGDKKVYTPMILIEMPKNQNIVYRLNENNKYDKLQMSDLKQLIDNGMKTMQGIPGFKNYLNRQKALNKCSGNFDLNRCYSKNNDSHLEEK